jgi:hypothetical protein
MGHLTTITHKRYALNLFYCDLTSILHLLQGELEHRRGKRFFKSVRKGKHAILGIGLQVRRQRLMHQLNERQKQQAGTSDSRIIDANDLPTVPFEEQETLPLTSPTQHHHISIDNRQKIQVSQWLHRNQADPAVKVCHSAYYCLSLEKLSWLLGLLTTSQEPFLITIA